MRRSDRKMVRPVIIIAKAYGDTIYELRAHKSRRWSQRDLAKAIGTSNSVVYAWEEGWTKPGKINREKLCKVFSIDDRQFRRLVRRSLRDIRQDGNGAKNEVPTKTPQPLDLLAERL